MGGGPTLLPSNLAFILAAATAIPVDCGLSHEIGYYISYVMALATNHASCHSRPMYQSKSDPHSKKESGSLFQSNQHVTWPSISHYNGIITRVSPQKMILADIGFLTIRDFNEIFSFQCSVAFS